MNGRAQTSFFFVVLIILPLFIFMPSVIFAELQSSYSVEQLQAQIVELQKQAQALQAQVGVAGGTAASPAAATCLNLTKNLYFGLSDAATSEEVTKLQRYLAADPTLYPEGLVTGYFGSLTQTAVRRFQARNGIVSSGSPATTGYGVLGPKTRAAILLKCQNDSLANSGADVKNFIKILSPNGNEVLPIGSTQTIRWQFSGAIPYVDIVLKEWFSPCAGDALCGAVNALARTYSIVKSAANNGLFSWIVGKDANNNDISANRYTITISNSAKTIYDVSDDFFAIAPANETPNITLFHPTSTTGSVAVTRGAITGMMWFAPLSVLRVNIFLEQGSGQYQIAKNFPNEGWFAWTAEKDITGAAIPAGAYVIAIEDADSSLAGKSAFTLTLN
ncbi:MAG: peptidoglycan-binding protein [Candidatus Liptonbacteria bacterium]|nr:peptidoglycan-binding protein [Candidatus Liptonbacteria bacterium]